jgi:molybdenum cofactor biosynthesis enzyme MoaA
MGTTETAITVRTRRAEAGYHRRAEAATDPAWWLPEFERYVPKTTHPAWRALQADARRQATELLGTLERPRHPTQDIGRRARSYATSARTYVDNRRRTRQGRDDLYPLYFIWTLLRSCNFTCEYCDDHTGHRYPELDDCDVLDTERAKRLLEIMRTRTSSVYFAGGEPTMRHDLPVLTRHARDLGYFPIIVNTNGSLLHRWLRRAEWRTWLADMDIVIVSVDALDTAVLADMWDWRHPEEVLRNVLLLRELAGPMRFKLMVNTVIQADHVAEASDVHDWAGDLGLWFCPVPLNVAGHVDDATTSSAAYHELVDKILRRKREGQPTIGSQRMNERLLRSAPFECRNTLKPHIDADGTLAWPCKASTNVAPVSVDVLDFDDVDALYAHATTLIDPTRFHGPARNQCGASCGWAQNYSTDAYVHGLRHPTRLVGDVVEFLRR